MYLKDLAMRAEISMGSLRPQSLWADSGLRGTYVAPSCGNKKSHLAARRGVKNRLTSNGLPRPQPHLPL
jgi:hypothetical protein